MIFFTTEENLKIFKYHISYLVIKASCIAQRSKKKKKKKKNTSCLVVRIGIDLSQICLFFFFFILLTRGRRTSAGLNKSSSRSSIHLQPSDFPARRNDQTNLCDRDTSVEKVGRLKSKFKSHPPLTRPLLLVPRLFRFILELMKHGGGMCVGALVLGTSCLLFFDNFRPRFFFFFSPPTKSRESKQH